MDKVKRQAWFRQGILCNRDITENPLWRARAGEIESRGTNYFFEGMVRVWWTCLLVGLLFWPVTATGLFSVRIKSHPAYGGKLSEKAKYCSEMQKACRSPLSKLRELMKTHGLSAYFVPNTDAHQVEPRPTLFLSVSNHA